MISSRLTVLVDNVVKQPDPFGVIGIQRLKSEPWLISQRLRSHQWQSQIGSHSVERAAENADEVSIAIKQLNLVVGTPIAPRAARVPLMLSPWM